MLTTTWDRYQAVSREDRSRTLDESATVDGHQYKDGIRLLAQFENGLGKVCAVEGRRMLRRGGPCLGSIRPTGHAPCRSCNFHPTPTYTSVGWSSA